MSVVVFNGGGSGSNGVVGTSNMCERFRVTGRGKMVPVPVFCANCVTGRVFRGVGRSPLGCCGDGRAFRGVRGLGVSFSSVRASMGLVVSVVGYLG